MTEFIIEMLKKLVEVKKRELNEATVKTAIIDKFTQGEAWQANYKIKSNARYTVELAEKLIEVLTR